MIISPPFIPTRRAKESDTTYLDRAMIEGSPGNGAFPVSCDLNWHGGVHLKAPIEGNTPLPVRAIADGTLAFFRQPTAYNSDASHPLNYGDAWTDDGCIVLRHETEIGEGEQALVAFYSIYQHLSTLELSDLTLGGKVYRRDILGQAGSIRDQRTPKIHFEIIANDASKLFGRNTSTLNHQHRNGRTDSCWGDAHFFLPAEVLCYEERPANWHSPENLAATIVSRPTEDLFIRLHYQKGQCTLSSFNGAGELIGEQQEAQDFEYDLFQIACARYPSCPSAGYEMLRYGRVLGPDALKPTEAAHWRQIALPNGPAWVNLNADTVTRFSDADFPHWLGWRLIDDDTIPDSHCQSPTIRSILNLDEEPIFPDHTDAISIASAPGYDRLPEEHKDFLAQRYEVEWQHNFPKLVAENKELQRFSFKFPSEWTHSDFDSRYGWWLKIHNNDIDATQDYQRLKAHQKALAFWEQANLSDIDSNHWHLPPRAFIEAFRKCGWLSASELKQLMPMSALRRSHGSWISETVQLSNRTKANLETLRIELNKSLQAHGIAASPIRLASFFGNAMQETQWFSKFHEGNSSAWYWPWDGRGFLQLTHAENYIKYWRFRGRKISESLRNRLNDSARTAHTARNNHALRDSHFHELTPEIIQWRDHIETRAIDAACSATAYWTWSGAARFADTPAIMLREVTDSVHRYSYYSNVSFGQVAATVNFGKPMSDTASITRVYGIQARYQAYTSALMALSEGLSFPDVHGNQHDSPEGYTPRRV